MCVCVYVSFLFCKEDKLCLSAPEAVESDSSSYECHWTNSNVFPVYSCSCTKPVPKMLISPATLVSALILFSELQAVFSSDLKILSYQQLYPLLNSFFISVSNCFLNSFTFLISVSCGNEFQSLFLH